MKKLKILMLNYEIPPLVGGAANATKYLLKEFAKRKDIEIDLITSSVDKHKVVKFAPNITIHFLDINKLGNLHYQSNKDLLRYSWKAYKYAKSLMKKQSFDLCHAFFGIPCGYIAMKLGLPYVVSLRGSDVPFYSKRFYWLDTLLFKRMSKKIWRNAKAVVANSDGLRNLALASSPAQKIAVIPNGIDTRLFTPVLSKKKSAKLQLISTGRLIERKGYAYLIEAIAGDKSVSLKLVGDGNLAGQLSALSSSKKANATFLGKKDQAAVIKELQRADVFVLPSMNEGMSNSVLEAMACGLPIITTDVGGSAELISDNGFIVEKTSSSSIRSALEKYKDARLLAVHGKASRKLALKMSWASVAGAYNEVYS